MHGIYLFLYALFWNGFTTSRVNQCDRLLGGRALFIQGLSPSVSGGTRQDTATDHSTRSTTQLSLQLAYRTAPRARTELFVGKPQQLDGDSQVAMVLFQLEPQFTRKLFFSTRPATALLRVTCPSKKQNQKTCQTRETKNSKVRQSAFIEFVDEKMGNITCHAHSTIDLSCQFQTKRKASVEFIVSSGVEFLQIVELRLPEALRLVRNLL